MSLLVWLPMTKDLTQQGLSDITVTNNGTTLNTNGKLGKCYYFDGNAHYLQFSKSVGDLYSGDFSYAVWLKPTDDTRSIICSEYAATGESGIAFELTASRQIRLYWNGSPDIYATGCVLPKDVWTHCAITRSGNVAKFYINGVLTYTYQGTLANRTSTAKIRLGDDYRGGTSVTYMGYMNDFRLYDHALSPREIEILSRGLVCHYPLCDISNQTPNNVAGSPTFNTSTATGNWAHWGASGSHGSYGQTTDKNYIYRKDQTYAHWVSNDSTATTYYIVYQSPGFSGGYRSMTAIIKEENGAKITESICYPGWNAHTGDHPQYTWDSITSLGNDFYLCKVDGFQQDGSNNLVCIHIPPGKKIYLSEFYIENDRTVCSDFFYPSTTVYDTSGFKNNGETYAYDTTGSIECSSDTARYSLSTFINSANVTNNATGIRYIYGNCELTTPQYLTVAFWCKPIAGYGGITNNGIFALTNNDIGVGAATDYNTAPMHNRDADIDMCTSTNVHKTMAFTTTANEWHHYAVVYDGRYGKVYKDGVHTATLDMGSNLSLASFKAIVIGYSHAGSVYRKVRAYYSDFRIYATALSAEQVAELYNTAVSVTNNGSLLGYELVEV